MKGFGICVPQERVAVSKRGSERDEEDEDRIPLHIPSLTLVSCLELSDWMSVGGTNVCVCPDLFDRSALLQPMSSRTSFGLSPRLLSQAGQMEEECKACVDTVSQRLHG